MFPFGQQVTVVSRVKSGTDSLGVDTFTESQTVYEPCPVWPGASGTRLLTVEGGGLSDQVTVDVSVLLPVGASVSAVDVLLISGQRYEIVGQPAVFSSPFTGRTPGVLVQGRRITG